MDAALIVPTGCHVGYFVTTRDLRQSRMYRVDNNYWCGHTTRPLGWEQAIRPHPTKERSKLKADPTPLCSGDFVAALLEVKA